MRRTSSGERWAVAARSVPAAAASAARSRICCFGERRTSPAAVRAGDRPEGVGSATAGAVGLVSRVSEPASGPEGAAPPAVSIDGPVDDEPLADVGVHAVGSGVEGGGGAPSGPGAGAASLRVGAGAAKDGRTPGP